MAVSADRLGPDNSAEWLDQGINATIRAYRDADAHYSFATERQIEPLTASNFVTLERRAADYPLGQRCPLYAYRIGARG